MRRAPAAAMVFVVLALVAAAAADRAGAQTSPAGDPRPADLRRLFPREADVRVEREGLSRLVLPAALVAACRPDLSDLRLFDPRGAEVPFLVDPGVVPGAGRELIRRFEPRVLEVTRRTVERRDGPPLRRETFDLTLPPAEAGVPATDWVLVVRTAPHEFVARVRIEAIGGDGKTATLIDEGSLFRLGGTNPAAKDRIPLPALPAGGLRVVLETEQGFWLEPAFRFESARILERGGRIAVPLEILASRNDDGRTIVELHRPPGIVPDLLRVETSTGTFDRQVAVVDAGPRGGEADLGSGRLFRVQALVSVGVQEIDLRGARGDRLRVAIVDGDSPPLADLRFAAVIRQPSLIFALSPAAEASADGVVRFGGGRAHRPRYDLAGLLPPTPPAVAGRRAEAAALLDDPAVVRPASLGPARANALFDGAPALGFAMHPGAAVDRRLFSHRRPITVDEASEGLSRLRLQPADLAVLKGNLADLRVADETGRQWSYLVEHQAATDLIPLMVEGPESEGGTSRYALGLPVTPLRADRILLDPATAYFDRAFRIEGEPVADVSSRPGRDAGATRVLARGRLARAIDDRRPVEVVLEAERVDALRLIVEDGDDAPLPIPSAQARVVLPDVYLTVPPGRYDLLLGSPDQEAPRYELERVRDVVLAVNATPVVAGELEANREFSLRARLAGGGLHRTVLLWATLIVAVVVLAVLTLRLARRDPAGPA